MEQNGFVCAAPDNANKMFTPLFASSCSPLFSFPNLVLAWIFFPSSCVDIIFWYFSIEIFFFCFVHFSFASFSVFLLFHLNVSDFIFVVSFSLRRINGATRTNTNLFIGWLLLLLFFSSLLCIAFVFFGHFTPVLWNETNANMAFFSVSVELKKNNNSEENKINKRAS